MHHLSNCFIFDYTILSTSIANAQKLDKCYEKFRDTGGYAYKTQAA